MQSGYFRPDPPITEQELSEVLAEVSPEALKRLEVLHIPAWHLVIFRRWYGSYGGRQAKTQKGRANEDLNRRSS